MAKKRPMTQGGALSDLAIEQAIHVVRGQRIMLDADLVALYEASTARLNEQVSRSRERFPDDFAFQLARQEFTSLVSQIAISSSRHGGRRTLPRAFTEHGVAMLSSVLRSPRAEQVNIAIVRTFVKLHRLLATAGRIVEQLSKLAETVQFHDHQIRAITDVLKRMIDEPPPTRRRIGFHAGGEPS